MRERIRPITSSLYPRHLSGSATKFAAQRVPREIVELRHEERKTLYQLREHIDAFVRRIQHVQQRSISGPSPEALMTQRTGRKQYISTERYRTGADIQRLANDIITHARELQEHCKDLEQEPYKDWAPGDPDIFTEQAQQTNPDFVALEQEEKARKLEIQARLKDITAQVDEAARAMEIAKKQGAPAAYAYLNKTAKRIESTKPVEPRKVKTTPQKTKDTTPKDVVSATWDDFDQQLMAQLDEEEAASHVKR